MDKAALSQYLTENADAAVKGTVLDMINERLPGIEGRSQEELEAIVAAIHTEAIAAFLADELTPSDAPEYEWKRIIAALAVDSKV